MLRYQSGTNKSLRRLIRKDFLLENRNHLKVG